MRSCLLILFAVAGCGSPSANADLGVDLTQFDLTLLPCTATFTGAVSGTTSGCKASAIYDSSLDQTTLTVSGTKLVSPMPTDATWAGVSVTFNGMPTPATYTNGDVISESTTISANSYDWMATQNDAQSFGTLTVVLAAVSYSTPLGGSLDSYIVDGSMVGTLVTAMFGPSTQLTLSF